MLQASAALYAGFAALSALFQMALSAGAPWGSLAMGGRYQGQLPRPIRAGAGVQAMILMTMGLSVADAGGLVDLDWPGWTLWITAALTALTAIGNAVTPSPAERKLWLPISIVMVGSLVIVMVYR